MKKYTAEQASWIKENATAKAWGNAHAFAEAFNAQFEDSRTVSSLLSYMQKRGIKFFSENKMTSEQMDWITENVQIIEWRNTKHFTDTFNALFGTHKSAEAMNSYLFNNGLHIRSKRTTCHYTDEMNEWLVEKYPDYECDFVQMAKDFNEKFGTDYSNCRIAKHCEGGLKIHKPRKKEPQFKNNGQFKKGMTNNRGLPVGTIRYNSDGRPFIKVLESDGKSKGDSRGHNYREPWWMPLQKKIWVDHFGDVPQGYEVVSLNGDPNDTDIRNIGIIDRRGKAVMAKKGWWTDNRVITGDGVQWCNLYYTAKDNGIVLKGENNNG